MAVKKVEYEIDINTKSANKSTQEHKKNVAELQKSYDDLSNEIVTSSNEVEHFGTASSATASQMDEVTASLSKIEENLKGVTSAFQAASNIFRIATDTQPLIKFSMSLERIRDIDVFSKFKTLQNILKRVIELTQKYVSFLDAAGLSQDKLNKSTQEYMDMQNKSTLDRVIDGLRSVKDFVLNIGENLAKLQQIMETVFNPEKVERFVKILRLMAFGLDFKGFDLAASKVNILADGVEKFNVKLAESGFLQKDLLEDLNKAADRLQMLEDVVQTVTQTFIVFAAATGGLILSKSIIDTLGNATTVTNISKISQEILLLKSSFSQLALSGSSLKNIYTSTLSVLSLFGDAFKNIFKDSAKIAGVFFDSFVVNTKTILTSLNTFKDVTASVLSTLGKGLLATTKDFSLFSGFVSTHATKSLLSFTDAAGLVATPLVAIGIALLRADSGFVRFIASVTIVIGLLMGGFAYAMKLALEAVGGFITLIGDYLLDTMAEFEAKFAKAQVAIVNYIYTFEGINRVTNGTLGTLEEWNNLLGEIGKTSIFSTDELNKMAQEIMQVGNSLGLTKSEMQEMARLIPEHAKAGDNLYDVTIAFMQALAGMGQGVIKYGIHVSESALEHSKLANNLGITVAQLTDTQKAQLRLGAIIEQSQPIIGKSAKQMETAAGSAAILEKEINRLQVRMGETNFITVLYNTTLAKFYKTLSLFPTPIIDIASGLQTVFGIAFKTIGTLMSYAFAIVSISTAFKLLSVALKESIILQGILNFSFAKIGSVLAINTVAITSFSTLLANLGRVSVAVVGVSLGVLKAQLIAVAGAVKIFTVALLTNPLFWKVTLIVGAIYATVKALVYLEERLGIIKGLFFSVQRTFNDVGESTSFFGKILDSILTGISVGANLIIKAFASIIVVMLNGINGISYVVVQLAKILTFSNVFTDNPIARWLNDWEESLESFAATAQNVLGETIGSMFSLAEVAQAQGLNGKVYNNLAESLKNAKKELLTDADKSKITAEVLGTQYQVLNLSKKLAEQNFATAKEIDEKKRLVAELYKLDLEMVKNIRDASKQADDAMNVVKESELSRTASIKNIIAASRLKLQKDLEPLLSQLDNLAFAPSNADTIEARKKIDDTILAMTRENLAKQKDDIQKFNDDKRKAQLEALSEFAKLTNNQTVIVNQEAQKQLEQFKKYEKEKKLTPAETSRALFLIEKNRLEKIAQLRKEIEDAMEANTLEGAKSALENVYNNGQVSFAEYARMQQSFQESALAKEQENYLKALKEKGVTGEAYAQAEIDAFAATEQRKQQLAFETEKKILDAKKAAAKDYDSLMGTTMQTTLQNFEDQRKALEKNKEFLTPQQFEKGKARINQQESFAKPVAGVTDALAPVQNVVGGVSGMVEGIAGAAGSIVSAIAKIPQIFSGLIDMVDSAMEAWLDFPTKIFDKFMASNEKLMQFPEKFLNNLGNALPKISGYLTKSLVDTVPRLIGSLIRGIPKFITGLIKAIPAVFDALIDGLISSVMSIKDAFSSFTDPESWKLGEAATKAVDAVSKSVTGVGAQLFGYVEQSGVSQAKTQANDIRQASKEGASWFIKAWEQLKYFGSWVANLIGSSIMAGVNLLKTTMDFLANLFATIANSIVATLEQSVTFVKEQFAALWELTKGVFSVIVDSFKWVFVDIIYGLVLKPIIDLFQWLFVDVVYKLVFKPIIASFQALWDFVVTVFDNPIQAFKDLWAAIKNIFANAFSDFLGAFVSLGNTFTNIWIDMKKAFSSAVKVLKDFFDTLGTYITTAFSSVFDFFKDLGSTIWNAISGAWGNVKKFFTDLFTFEKSEGKVEEWLGFDFPWVKFAEGGNVPGVAKVAGDSLKNDTVPALLSAGEYVLPRSVTQDKDLMAFIMRLIDSNKKVGKFGKGGDAVDWLTSKAKSVGTAVVDTVSSAASSVGSVASDIVGGIVEGAKWVGDLLVPDWVQEKWDSIMRYIPNIDFTEFVKHPVDTAEKAIKNSFGFIKDLMIPDVKKLLGFANGGLVGGTDTIPAMLTPGEFVVSKPAVQQYGVGALNALNKGMLGGGSTSNTTNNIELTLNFKTEQPIDEKYVKNVMMPTIKDELRRLSLDGRRVLATSGVR